MNRKRVYASALIVTALIVSSLLLSFLLHERAKVNGTDDEAKWSGMDESVIEKYAEDNGRSASEPLIPVEEGDLLLFLFAVGGFVSGVVVGYCWNKLFSKEERLRLKEKPEEMRA